MTISLRQFGRPRLAIAGHAGCGHVHSHNGFVQDDSAGLAVVIDLFRRATGIDPVVKSVAGKVGLDGYFEVFTSQGGTGRCSARRGITPQEMELAQRLVGRSILSVHTLAVEAFGRLYGQGAHEPAVALETALANAALDTFAVQHPYAFTRAQEDSPNNCGLMVGTLLEIEGETVAVLGTVNATEGGIGPNEDLEGNALAGSKREIMDTLGMAALPTIVLESKTYWPAACNALDEPQFLIRAHSDSDNVHVAEALLAAAEAIGRRASYLPEQLARQPGALRQQTMAFGRRVAALGERIQVAEDSADKVALIAELIEYASQDGGGISFMSNAWHEVVGGIGMMPGTSAVLSLLVPRRSIEQTVIPCVDADDVKQYSAIVCGAVAGLRERLAAANDVVIRHQLARQPKEASKMGKVVVISTGGTIAMKSFPGRGTVPALSGTDLIEAIPQLVELGEVEVREFSNIPSPHMTPAMMFNLSKTVEKVLAESAVQGVVITHGTDTLEETAYMLDLLIDSEKPVCLVGAMRAASCVSPDGPVNIYSAVRTAFCAESRGKGVLVVMNDKINAAREVTETHPVNPDSFCSPLWGALGYVDTDCIVYRRQSLPRRHLKPTHIEPEVYLLRLTSGSDSLLIDCLVDKNVKGIVIEAFGRGNVPPPVVPGIKRACDAGIPVVISTRCGTGRVYCEYGYEGSAKHALSVGAILAGDLPGNKARLKLMLAISLGMSRDEIEKVFAEESAGVACAG